MEDIGSLVVKLALDGEKFDSGIKRVNQQLKVVDSSFAASSKIASGMGTSLDSLKSKHTQLNQTLSLQEKKVQMYGQELDKAKSSLNKTATAQSELKSKIDLTGSAYEKSKSSV